MLERWEPAELSEPDSFGAECEAFLAGDWAEYQATHGEDVPHWAWLNRVAHAPEIALRMAVQAPPWGHRTFDEWTRLRLCVAERLLQQAAVTRVPVSHLQRAALVPLGLALFDDERLSRFGGTELLSR